MFYVGEVILHFSFTDIFKKYNQRAIIVLGKIRTN